MVKVLDSWFSVDESLQGDVNVKIDDGLKNLEAVKETYDVGA